MDNKLNELIARCKCGVHLTINAHRDVYISAKEELEKLDSMECPPEITKDVREKMIEKDTIIDLQFYPHTPIGFYNLYHHDLGTILSESLKIMDKIDGKPSN